MAAILEGKTDIDKDALAKLRKGQQTLKEVMGDFYEGAPRRGIAAHLGERTITFVPLYHPAARPWNRYEGDYEALKELLSPTGADEIVAIEGVLRGVHLDHGWLEVATQDHVLVRIEGIGDALDDVVGPMVNRPVVVTAVRREQKFLYRDIGLEE